MGSGENTELKRLKRSGSETSSLKTGIRISSERLLDSIDALDYTPPVIRWALEWAQLYKLTQWILYRPGEQERYVAAWIRPRQGDRVLDIGCGPAPPLQFMPAVDYVGYDPNPRYIDDA